MSLVYQWPQGCTHILLPISLTASDGSVADLTNVATNNITLAKRQILGNVKTAFVTMGGSVTVTTPSSGAFTYHFAAADVAIPGTYEIRAEVVFGVGDILYTFPQRFQIVATS